MQHGTEGFLMRAGGFPARPDTTALAFPCDAAGDTGGAR